MAQGNAWGEQMANDIHVVQSSKFSIKDLNWILECSGALTEFIKKMSAIDMQTLETAQTIAVPQLPAVGARGPDPVLTLGRQKFAMHDVSDATEVVSASADRESPPRSPSIPRDDGQDAVSQPNATGKAKRLQFRTR